MEDFEESSLSGGETVSSKWMSASFSLGIDAMLTLFSSSTNRTYRKSYR